jgi:GNAT superfamily N-acetyltransferase
MSALMPEFRPIGMEGLLQLVDWAAAEGWNPGPHDAAVFYQTDADGFFGCFVDERMVGGGSIVSYNGEFGFMGFFIVLPEYRSKGLGRELWIKRRNRLISRLKDGATIGMDGVVSMQAFYQRGGFEIGFRDERYACTGRIFSENEQVRTATSADFDAIQQLDRACFGFDRSRFLKAWLEMPESTTFCFSTTDTLMGFAHLRKAQHGYKIGPLFADTPEVADALYRSCLNHVPGEPVFLDIPVSNLHARNLVKQYDATYVFECARMYHGPSPSLPIDRIYGITSFELG